MTRDRDISTSTSERRQSLEHVIEHIELEMRRVCLWEKHSPGTKACDSDLPFCCDTLAFHQWLQWLFLPRMQRILTRGEPLPDASAILPYAEETLSLPDDDSSTLLFLLGSFDELINQKVPVAGESRLH